MSETTQEQMRRLQDGEADIYEIKDTFQSLCKDADRLARIEAACLLRSEIDAPEWATTWIKTSSSNGKCWFVGAEEVLNGEVSPRRKQALDYRPNESGPITLPIVEA